MGTDETVDDAGGLGRGLGREDGWPEDGMVDSAAVGCVTKLEDCEKCNGGPGKCEAGAMRLGVGGRVPKAWWWADWNTLYCWLYC